jgi:hypothetical protein
MGWTRRSCMTDSPRELRGLILLAAAWTLCVLMVGCSSASVGSQTPAVAGSPTVDTMTKNYIDLANSYWDAHVTATGGAITVCLGTGTGTQGINPPLCRVRAVAMLAVQEKFLSDLDLTPPPTKFAADDRVFRTQLPKTVADLKAMISAADAGTQQGILDAANAFLDDMGLVLGALNHINPSVEHV